MKKWIVVVSFVTSFLVLTGCSSSPVKTEQERKVNRMTIVSSAKPIDVLPSFKSFTWNKEYSRVLSAVSATSEKNIQQYIQDEIILYLKTKGYVYQPNAQEADVVIGFLFALEDDLADKRIQEQFGLLPGVSSNSVTGARYEKGSLLLAVLDNKLERVYWRSAMQGFVDFEKDRNDDSIHQMQVVLGMMMRGFPEAGK